MKEIIVISGKGGTGKTSLVACFATIADNKVLADCDVDAADLHLVLEPRIKHQEEFRGSHEARIIEENCTSCGKCYELCRFGAIRKLDGRHRNGEQTPRYQVDPIGCEGCGVCVRFCPAAAISFQQCVTGEWFISDTRHGPMVHARLGVAQGNSGKLVTLVRNRARELALAEHKELIIVDGAPGIGCPVIASITGADLVFIVTEATLSGLHDFGRVAALAAHFRIPAAACINKYDLNPDVARQIEEASQRQGVRVLGRVPYDSRFTEAQMHKASLIEYSGGATSQAVKKVWRQITYLPK